MERKMITREQSNRFIGHFKTIAHGWELTPPEQMKLLGLSTLEDLEAYLSGKRKLSNEMFLNIHYLTEIYTGLHTLLPAASAANSWVRKPNSYRKFRGRTALYCMMNGKVPIKTVRDYVMSQLV